MAIDLVLCICVFGCVRLVWGEGWLLWVRGAGIMVTGYKSHQDPRIPPPLRGDTWPISSQLPTSQFTRQPSSLTPRWQPLTHCPSSRTRQKKLNPLVCHQRALFVSSDNTAQTDPPSTALSDPSPHESNGKKSWKIKSTYLMFHITITATTKPNIPSVQYHCGQLIVTTNHRRNAADGRLCLCASRCCCSQVNKFPL